MPAEAVEGSTTERADAYNSLSSTEQESVAQQLQGFIDAAQPSRGGKKTYPLTIVNALGMTVEVSSEASE